MQGDGDEAVVRVESVQEFLQRGGQVRRLPSDARGEAPPAWKQKYRYEKSKLTWSQEPTHGSGSQCVCGKSTAGARVGWVAKLPSGKVVRRLCSEGCKLQWLQEG